MAEELGIDRNTARKYILQWPRFLQFWGIHPGKVGNFLFATLGGFYLAQNKSCRPFKLSSAVSFTRLLSFAWTRSSLIEIIFLDSGLDPLPYMAKQEVNTRWQKAMERFFVKKDPSILGPETEPLEEVFYLR